jgi:hypothetical protein
MIDQFRKEQLDIATFEAAYLGAMRSTAVADPRLVGPMEQIFLALEAYDLLATSATETVHNISYASLVRSVQEARSEIAARLSDSEPSQGAAARPPSGSDV